MERFAAECMVCTINKQEKSLPAEWSEEKKAAFMRELLKLIADTKSEECPPVVTVRINALRDRYGLKPADYTEIKKSFNRLMLDIAPKLREKIEAAEDKIHAAMQYARSANYIDFGTLNNVTEEGLLEILEKAVSEAVDPAEYANFRRDLEKAESFVYLTDNCGEVVADMLLIEQIRAAYPALKVTAIVRGEDVLNDATMEDARMVGLDKVCDTIGNGNGVAGTWRAEMDEVSLGRLNSADVILGKGLANFETLNGCGLNAYYLFLCKCSRFQHLFNMQKFQGVLANDHRLGGRV